MAHHCCRLSVSLSSRYFDKTVLRKTDRSIRKIGMKARRVTIRASIMGERVRRPRSVGIWLGSRVRLKLRSMYVLERKKEGRS